MVGGIKVLRTQPVGIPSVYRLRAIKLQAVRPERPSFAFWAKLIPSQYLINPLVPRASCSTAPPSSPLLSVICHLSSAIVSFRPAPLVTTTCRRTFIPQDTHIEQSTAISVIPYAPPHHRHPLACPSAGRVLKVKQKEKQQSPTRAVLPPPGRAIPSYPPAAPLLLGPLSLRIEAPPPVGSTSQPTTTATTVPTAARASASVLRLICPSATPPANPPWPLQTRPSHLLRLICT